jgi:ABC-2 type transport system permease protein
LLYFSNYQRIVPLVFEGDYILNTGFVDLTPFFHLYALDFDILIPAVTMRSFSDEKKNKER